MSKQIIKKICCPYCRNEQQVKWNPWTVKAKCQNKKCKKWFDVRANEISK